MEARHRIVESRRRSCSAMQRSAARWRRRRIAAAAAGWLTKASVLGSVVRFTWRQSTPLRPGVDQQVAEEVGREPAQESVGAPRRPRPIATLKGSLRAAADRRRAVHGDRHEVDQSSPQQMIIAPPG